MSFSNNFYAEKGIVYVDSLDTPIRGIDVSDWQRDIDWRAVKRSGIQFDMIRCGWSDDGVDGKFEQNVRNARAAGVKIGTYLYSYAGSVAEAKREADHCLRIIRRFPAQYFEYTIVFDIEEEGQNGRYQEGQDITSELCLIWLGLFVRRLRVLDVMHLFMPIQIG